MTRPRHITSAISGSNWPDEMANGIFIQWCIHLATTELGLTQWSGPSKPTGSVTFSNPAAGRSFTVSPAVPLSWKVTEILDIDSEDIRSVVALAAAKTRTNDSGAALVYQVTMECPTPPLDGDKILNMFRMMGDQVPITGSRRLSDVALLDFSQNPPPQPQISGSG